MTDSNNGLAFLDTPPATEPTPQVEPVAPTEPAAAPQALVPDPTANPPVAPMEPPKVDAHTVPLPKYLDAYNEAKEYKKQIAEYQAKEREAQARAQAQAPDPLLDPKGYGDYVRNQMRGEMQGEILQTRLNVSEDAARLAYGDAIVDEAKQALEAKAAQQPWVGQRIMGARSPWHEMVAWHKQEQLLGEIGDPSKLNDWIATKYAALNPGGQPAGGTPPPAPLVPPPMVEPPRSLSRAPAAAKPSDAPVGPGQAFSQMFDG